MKNIVLQLHKLDYSWVVKTLWALVSIASGSIVTLLIVAPPLCFLLLCTCYFCKCIHFLMDNFVLKKLDDQ